MSGAFVDYVKPDKPSGILIYRRRFPQELVPFIPHADGRGMGRKELRASLLAKNMDDLGAVSRWQDAKAEYDRIVAKAEKASAIFHKRATGSFDTLSAPEIAYLAEVYRQEQLENDDKARWDPDERNLFQAVAAQLSATGVGAVSPWVGREGVRWASKTREAVEASLAERQTMRANGDLDAILAFWREEALELAEAHGSVIDPADTVCLSALCRALNEAAITTGKELLVRLGGDEYPETPPEPERSGRVPEAPTASLLDLFDGYAAAQAISPGVRKEWRRYIAIFTEFLGHDDAHKVNRDDVVAWRDHLLKTPNRLGKLRKPVTVRDKYMTALNGTLNWAVEERHLATNVAGDVAVRVPRPVKLRSPDYTMDEARAILRASLQPTGPQLPPVTARARRWVPWLCAYSGARVGELAQLRKRDIRQHDGVWMMNLTPEAGSVKTREARLVPIHAHVIEQGFLDELKRLPEGPLFYNPDNRRAPEDDDGNRHAKKVGERLAKWVRGEVGITDPTIKPNHAWRHLFATIAEEAGIPERTYNAIQGHAPANTARRYGSTTTKAKAEAIERFPRFNLDE
jgi:integrase